MLRKAATIVSLAAATFHGAAFAQNCAPFTDVLASSGFCGNIQWLYNRGITLGCTPSQFCPSQFVRRDQMAAFLYRLGFENAFLKGGNAFGATAVLGTTDSQALDVRVNNSRVMRYEPNAVSPNVIGGHPANNVTAGVRGATIAGGGVPAGNSDPSFFVEAPNRVTDAYGTVGGGYANRAGDDAGTAIDRPFATVGGGQANSASGTLSTVAGGEGNEASGTFSTVSGGGANDAIGIYSNVAGGLLNTAQGSFSMVIGGERNNALANHSIAGGNSNDATGFNSAAVGGLSNTAGGDNSFVAGGVFNIASGHGTFAAGFNARANGNNCAVFSLWGADPGMQCFGNESQFMIGALHGLSVDYHAQRADGGGTRFVYIGNNFPPFTITTWNGATLGDNGVWNSVSDVAKKEAFAEVDKRAILEKLAALPIRSFRYRVETDDVRHIGPTGQDFRAAFGLGHDERTIGSVDADGVALAAIQGLNAKLEATLAERDARIASLAEELAQQRTADDTRAREIVELRQLVKALLVRVAAHH